MKFLILGGDLVAGRFLARTVCVCGPPCVFSGGPPCGLPCGPPCGSLCGSPCGPPCGTSCVRLLLANLHLVKLPTSWTLLFRLRIFRARPARFNT